MKRLTLLLMRHDTVANNSDIVVHLAAALSARDLHSEVQKRCPEGTPILHYSGYGYNFGLRGKPLQPPVGTIKVKYMVQSRQLRQNHEDMHQHYFDT